MVKLVVTARRTARGVEGLRAFKRLFTSTVVSLRELGPAASHFDKSVGLLAMCHVRPIRYMQVAASRQG